MRKSTSTPSLSELGARGRSSGSQSPLLARSRSPSPMPSQVQGAPSQNLTSRKTALNAMPPFVTAELSHHSFSDPDPIEMTLKNPYTRHSISAELELEASLHVSSFQALACEAQFPTQTSFGFPLLHQAPSLTMEHTMSNSSSNLQSLAACLATPFEPPASPAHANSVGRAMAQLQQGGVAEEVQNVINKWSDWVRRVRRKRRLEAVASLLTIRTNTPDDTKTQ